MRRYPGFICTCLLVFLCIGVAEAGSTIPGEAIVLFRNVEGTRLTRGSSMHGSVQYRIAAEAAASEARVVGTYGALSEAVNEVFALIRSENRTTEQLMESLRANPNVLAISPNRPVYATDFLSGDEKVPNDSSFGRLWGMAAIDAPRSWIETTGDASVHVAVLDTGIAVGHEDLKDNIDTSRSRNFTPLHNSYEDDAGHGTHVSGVIGAVGNNGVGVAGVNWTTRIISFKVLNSFGYGSTATIMKALDGLLALLNDEPDLKVAAVNLSLGGYDFESPDEAMANSAEWRAYKALDDTNRILIVVAAGNEGLEVGKPAPFDDPKGGLHPRFRRGQYGYPASFVGLKNMIVVGATTKDGRGAKFSNWSQTRVDIAAPGKDIYSTTPKGVVSPGSFVPFEAYEFMSGTSMAAPHVSGAAGLLMSKYPSLDAGEIKEALLNGANSDANPVAEPFRDEEDYRGINPDAQRLSVHGLINLKGSFDWLREHHPAVPPDPGLNPGHAPGPNPTPNPGPGPSPNPKPNPVPSPSPNPNPNPRPNPGPAPSPSPIPEPKSGIKPVMPEVTRQGIEPVKPVFFSASSSEQALRKAAAALRHSGLNEMDLVFDADAGVVQVASKLAERVAEKVLPHKMVQGIGYLPVLSAEIAEKTAIAALGIERTGAELMRASEKVAELKLIKILGPDEGEMMRYTGSPEAFDDGAFTVLDAGGRIVDELRSEERYVLTLFLRDGGKYDLDGSANGNIVDPLVLVSVAEEPQVRPEPEPKPHPRPQPKLKGKGSSGGCATGSFGLSALVSSGIFLLAFKRRTR